DWSSDVCSSDLCDFSVASFPIQYSGLGIGNGRLQVDTHGDRTVDRVNAGSVGITGIRGLPTACRRRAPILRKRFKRIRTMASPTPGLRITTLRSEEHT